CSLMNKDNAAQYLPLVQAVADGKVIQHNPHVMVNAEWIDLHNPAFTEPPENYRIKPEPREFWIVVTPSGAIWSAYGAERDANACA
ncbi:hypothetical protein IAI19_11655, partial [Streptococcus pseudopneumoniae]|nr:hypothetical protein [Streptococcus pseudopneumoniae]